MKLQVKFIVYLVLLTITCQNLTMAAREDDDNPYDKYQEYGTVGQLQEAIPFEEAINVGCDEAARGGSPAAIEDDAPEADTTENDLHRLARQGDVEGLISFIQDNQEALP